MIKAFLCLFLGHQSTATNPYGGFYTAAYFRHGKKSGFYCLRCKQKVYE